jgi:hypothetical protein
MRFYLMYTATNQSTPAERYAKRNSYVGIDVRRSAICLVSACLQWARKKSWKEAVELAATYL